MVVGTIIENDLVYLKDYIPQPTYCGQNLLIEGTQIKKPDSAVRNILQRSVTENTLKLKLHDPKIKPAIKTHPRESRQTFKSVNIAELHSFRHPPTPVNSDSLFTHDQNLRPDKSKNRLEAKSSPNDRVFDPRSDLDQSS